MPKKSRKMPTFPGSIEILTAGNAVKQAYTEHTASQQDVTRLVLWTDGSAGSLRNLNRGFAVAWRRAAVTGWDRWESAGYR
jgi:hypothetical protein